MIVGKTLTQLILLLEGWKNKLQMEEVITQYSTRLIVRTDGERVREGRETDGETYTQTEKEKRLRIIF